MLIQILIPTYACHSQMCISKNLCQTSHFFLIQLGVSSILWEQMCAVKYSQIWISLLPENRTWLSDPASKLNMGVIRNVRFFKLSESASTFHSSQKYGFFIEKWCPKIVLSNISYFWPFLECNCRLLTVMTNFGPEGVIAGHFLRINFNIWKIPLGLAVPAAPKSTRSMVYNGTGYKGNFGPSTEALFSEWRHCYFITVTS